MCFVLYSFYTVRQYICTVWLNVNIDQMKNVTSSSSSFFFFFFWYVPTAFLHHPVLLRFLAELFQDHILLKS